jgi:hypothetical protein
LCAGLLSASLWASLPAPAAWHPNSSVTTPVGLAAHARGLLLPRRHNARAVRITSSLPLGGVIVPFAGIKLIDLVMVGLHLVA